MLASQQQQHHHHHHQQDPSSSSLSSSLACARRRSVDVGGLSLALQNNGRGHGWGGWDEGDISQYGPRYAELLTEMRTHTLLAVNEHHAETPAVELPSATRTRLIESLDSWNFEPHKLSEEELLECTLVIFEALFRVEGLQEAVRVSLDQIPPFVRHLRQIYRSQNSYHNFQHALDVLQATHTFLRSAGMVPPVSILLDGSGGKGGGKEWAWQPNSACEEALVRCLSPVDLFTVYVAAIGHDVGHPGFSNVFMKNAKTPLSVVYGDKSALEQMHCTLLLHVMRYHGMSHLLDHHETGGGGMSFRKLLVETVLATDMSVHVDFMKRFEEMVAGGESGSSLWNRKLLMCQALIKCADISNPSRPHRVSQYWANALMEEWSAQASLERHFQLPATVKPSEDPVTEAKGQVFFINAFAKPLLELTTRAIPEMEVYAQQCAANLTLWGLRCTGLEDATAAVVATALPNSSTAAASSSSTGVQEDHDHGDVQAGSPNHTKNSDSGRGDEGEGSAQVKDSSSASSSSSSPSPTTRSPEDFSTAFPLTLPGAAYFALQQEEMSGEVEVCTCHGGKRVGCSPPSSPGSAGEMDGSGMWISYPAMMMNGRDGATAALRAAYEASARKKKSVNRNSWGERVGWVEYPRIS